MVIAVYDLNLCTFSIAEVIPLFEQCTVQQKVSSFHSKLISLEFHRCSTCLESFPDLNMAAAGSTECRPCSQDKHIPKLHSSVTLDVQDYHQDL